MKRASTLLLTGLAAGSLLLQPAFANHTPTHTQQQIKKLNTKLKKRYTKKKVDVFLAGKADTGAAYTKAEADGLFAPAGASYTRAEADARFVAYARTIVVPADGQALRDAAAAAGGATAHEPWLLLLEPGTFDLGTRPLTLPAHVDVQGSGRGASTIACGCGDGDGGAGAAAVAMGANTELRDLRIENEASTAFAYGIAIEGSGTFALTDVAVEVIGTASSAFGIWAIGGDLRMRGVEIEAEASAAFQRAVSIHDAASVDLQGLRARAAGAGTNTGLHVTNTTFAHVEGGIFEAANGAENHAIRLSGSEARLVGVTADATGGGDRYFGVYALNSDLTMAGGVVGARGEEGYGVTLRRTLASGGSLARIEGATITSASTVCCGFGVGAESSAGASAMLLVNSSEILASSQPSGKADGAGAALRIGGSLMTGDSAFAMAGGSVVCAGVWDDGYAFSASSCPVVT